MAGVLACGMSVSRDTRWRVEYAQGYIGLGMYEDAWKELESIAAEDQLRAEVRSMRVDYHVAKKQWEKAVVVAAELARAHPGVENAWIGWAYALRELGQVEEARAVLRVAETHHGKTSAVLHYNLACYESLLGALERARQRLEIACKMEQQFKEAAKEDPDLEALRNAGMVGGAES